MTINLNDQYYEYLILIIYTQNLLKYRESYFLKDSYYDLMKKGLFTEAKKIANDAKFPEDIIAEICKEHADKLYS